VPADDGGNGATREGEPRDIVGLRAGDAALAIDPDTGARFASFMVGGHEVLVTRGQSAIEWGCYPMAPFAGRIRDGRFTFQGQVHQLATNLPPNAIHGTVFGRPWEVTKRAEDRAEFTTDLGPGWPFRGRVTQSIMLRPDSLTASLSIDAEEPMPAWLGWHPWFRRAIAGSAADPDVDAGRMYARDADGLPTGELIDPTPGPWDDAFADMSRSPRLTWPGVLTLEIESAADVWVVYDERPHAICIEPQTAPPDAINLRGVEVAVAEPGRPVSTSMTWRWRAGAASGVRAGAA
jgi:aldose 1-epimerase